jgi:Lrp/AsnC family transcriptional regulator for asnA, asnC and gidA
VSDQTRSERGTVIGQDGLDEVDLRILAELVRDGRSPVNEFAKPRRRFESDRICALRPPGQTDGVITGFRAEVDPDALGYTITAMILVNVEQGELVAGAREQLVHLPGFEYLAVTSGGFDFVVLVRVTRRRVIARCGASPPAPNRGGQVDSDGLRPRRGAPAARPTGAQLVVPWLHTA